MTGIQPATGTGESGHGCEFTVLARRTGKALLIILGIWLLVQGAGRLRGWRSADHDDPNRLLLIMTGGAFSVVGVVLIVWPGAGAGRIS